MTAYLDYPRYLFLTLLVQSIHERLKNNLLSEGFILPILLCLLRANYHGPSRCLATGNSSNSFWSYGSIISRIKSWCSSLRSGLLV